jgi:hypothetical protein
VGADGTLLVSKMSFVYIVVPSGNVRLVSTSAATSDVSIANCTFSVNGTWAVVPQTFIYHSGGRIVIQDSSFTGVSLSAQPLISFVGFLFYLFIYFFFFRCGT